MFLMGFLMFIPMPGEELGASLLSLRGMFRLIDKVGDVVALRSMTVVTDPENAFTAVFDILLHGSSKRANLKDALTRREARHELQRV